MAEPVLVQPIPDQVVNEMASFGPLDLKNFIQSPDSVSQFSAELKSGESLPKGMILTSDGILTGIPGKDTQGLHEVIVTATNDSGSLKTTFVMTIKPSLASNETAYVEKLKAQVWEAVNQSLPIPPIDQLLSLPITKLDIYYILELWGTLTIWDAFNLDPPHEKHLLTLEGVSQHYNVYDRGSSLIMCPKDLFSHERTIRDGIKTAKALAREVYKRDWTIEMAGLDKWTRAAWVELQRLGDVHGKRLEIINYQPSEEEIRAYTEQVAHQATNVPE
jgi:hypothetical protein